MNEIALRQVSLLTEQAAVRHLCRNYRDFLIQRVAKPEIIETYYASAAFEAFLFSLPRLHARPQGTIFLAYLDHRPVGCCMTHGVGGKTCDPSGANKARLVAVDTELRWGSLSMIATIRLSSVATKL